MTHRVLFPLPGCRPAADVPKSRNGSSGRDCLPKCSPGQDWKDLLLLPEPRGHGAGRGGVAEANGACVTATSTWEKVGAMEAGRGEWMHPTAQSEPKHMRTLGRPCLRMECTDLIPPWVCRALTHEPVLKD